jgi:hypothetical protein
MATTRFIVYGDPSDGRLGVAGADWNEARNGSASSINTTSIALTSLIQIGTGFAVLEQCFIVFDLGFAPVGLHPASIHLRRSFESAGGNKAIEIRQAPWTQSLSDYVPPGAFDGLPLVGYRSSYVSGYNNFGTYSVPGGGVLSCVLAMEAARNPNYSVADTEIEFFSADASGTTDDPYIQIDLPTTSNVFTTTGAGSFTLPANATNVVVETWGGGAGGANVAGQAAGGGGGAYASSNLGSVGGQTVFFSVGTGGTSGNAGGQTWARIGTNAAPTTASEGALAAGGAISAGGTVAASIGEVRFAGGAGAAAQGGGGARAGSGGGGGAGSNGAGNNGTQGSGGTTVGSGGAGGTPDGGNGGNGGVSGATGQAGFAPGGGGGGSGSSFTGSGSGARGQVRISWTELSPPGDSIGQSASGSQVTGVSQQVLQSLDTLIEDFNNGLGPFFQVQPNGTLADIGAGPTYIDLLSNLTSTALIVSSALYEVSATNTFVEVAWPDTGADGYAFVDMYSSNDYLSLDYYEGEFYSFYSNNGDSSYGPVALSRENARFIRFNLLTSNLIKLEASPDGVVWTTVIEKDFVQGAGGISFYASKTLEPFRLYGVNTIEGQEPPPEGDSTGTSAGTTTVAGAGATTSTATGSATATATVTGVGARLISADGTSAGAATVAGVGASSTLLQADANAAGTSTADGVGSKVIAATGTGAGAASVTGAANTSAVGTGSATGVATVSGSLSSTVSVTGSASGSANVSGISGASLFAETDGSSTGVGTTTGAGAALVQGIGSAAAASEVTGSASGIHSATGSSAGQTSVEGQSAASLFGETNGSSAGASEVFAQTAALAETTGTVSGTGTVDGIVQAITSVGYTVAGLSTADGGGTSVFSVLAQAEGEASFAIETAAHAETTGSSSGSSTVYGEGQEYIKGLVLYERRDTEDGLRRITEDGEERELFDIITWGIGAVSGTSTSTGQTGSVVRAEAVSTGAASVTGISGPVGSGAGTATGVGVSTGLSSAVGSAQGACEGFGTVIAWAAKTSATAASVEASASVSGSGASTWRSTALAAGLATVAAIGGALIPASGASAGLGATTGQGSGTSFATAISAGLANVSGIGQATEASVSDFAVSGGADTTGSGASIARTIVGVSGSALGLGTGTAISYSMAMTTGEAVVTSQSAFVTFTESVGNSSGLAMVSGQAATTTSLNTLANSVGISTAEGVGSSTAWSGYSTSGTAAAAGVSEVVGGPPPILILPLLTVDNSSAPNGWTSAPNGALTAINASDQDANFGHAATNATGTYTQGWQLQDMPGDFGKMDTLTIQLRYGWSAFATASRWPLLAARIVAGSTVLAAADIGGGFQTVAETIETTVATNSSVVNFAYINADAGKALWDAAVLEIRIDRTRSGGGNTNQQRIYAAQSTGTYFEAVNEVLETTATGSGSAQAIGQTGAQVTTTGASTGAAIVTGQSTGGIAGNASGTSAGVSIAAGESRLIISTSHTAFSTIAVTGIGGSVSAVVGQATGAAVATGTGVAQNIISSSYSATGVAAVEGSGASFVDVHADASGIADAIVQASVSKDTVAASLDATSIVLGQGASLVQSTGHISGSSQGTIYTSETYPANLTISVVWKDQAISALWNEPIIGSLWKQPVVPGKWKKT